MEKPERSAWKVPWKGIIVTLLVSIIAIIAVFSKVANPREILGELASYPLVYFFGALLFVLAAWIVDGQRIGMLTRALDLPMPWWQLALILGAANFLTLVTPFAGGGGALIAYLLYQRGMGVPSATAVVVAGGMAGQMSLATLSLLVFSSIRDVPPEIARYLNYVRLGALGYIAILVTLIIVIFKSERLFHWLFRKKGSESRSVAWLDEFRSTYRTLVLGQKTYYFACLLVAFSYYAVYYMGGFVLLSGFGVLTPLLRYAISVLFGIAPVFSPIPGAAGFSELIAYMVLDGVLAKESLGTFIVLWRTVVFYIPILLGGSVFSYLALRWASQGQKSSEEEPRLEN